MLNASVEFQEKIPSGTIRVPPLNQRPLWRTFDPFWWPSGFLFGWKDAENAIIVAGQWASRVHNNYPLAHRELPALDNTTATWQTTPPSGIDRQLVCLCLSLLYLAVRIRHVSFPVDRIHCISPLFFPRSEAQASSELLPASRIHSSSPIHCRNGHVMAAIQRTRSIPLFIYFGFDCWLDQSRPHLHLIISATIGLTNYPADWINLSITWFTFLNESCLWNKLPE